MMLVTHIVQIRCFVFGCFVLFFVVFKKNQVQFFGLGELSQFCHFFEKTYPGPQCLKLHQIFTLYIYIETEHIKIK
jgi:hypothetical protein